MLHLNLSYAAKYFLFFIFRTPYSTNSHCLLTIMFKMTTFIAIDIKNSIHGLLKKCLFFNITVKIS